MTATIQDDPLAPLGQGIEQPAEEAGDNGETSSIMADLTGRDGLDAPLIVKKSRRIPSQLMLMALVLAISASAIYLMRLVGMGAGMNFVVTPIDYVLDGTPADRVAEHQRILDELAQSDVLAQVPADKVDKNPFHLVLPTTEEVDISGLDEDAKARIAAERERMQQQAAKDALSTLRINSIMNGRVPIANVNDKLVRIGDTISGLKVIDIQDRHIVVEAGGEQYTIHMDKSDG